MRISIRTSLWQRTAAGLLVAAALTIVTAGPAASPDAAAVLTKSPAPMMAPIPSAINPGAVSVRLSPPA